MEQDDFVRDLLRKTGTQAITDLGADWAFRVIRYIRRRKRIRIYMTIVRDSGALFTISEADIESNAEALDLEIGFEEKLDDEIAFSKSFSEEDAKRFLDELTTHNWKNVSARDEEPKFIFEGFYSDMYRRGFFAKPDKGSDEKKMIDFIMNPLGVVSSDSSAKLVPGLDLLEESSISADMFNGDDLDMLQSAAEEAGLAVDKNNLEPDENNREKDLQEDISEDKSQEDIREDEDDLKLSDEPDFEL